VLALFSFTGGKKGGGGYSVGLRYEKGEREGERTVRTMESLGARGVTKF